jgi:hypothetical protein
MLVMVPPHPADGRLTGAHDLRQERPEDAWAQLENGGAATHRGTGRGGLLEDEVASARSARKPAVWTLCRGLYRVVEAPFDLGSSTNASPLARSPVGSEGRP